MHPDMVLYANVEAFGILTNQNEVYVFVAARGYECLNWAYVCIQVEGLSKCHVDRPKA